MLWHVGGASQILQKCQGVKWAYLLVNVLSVAVPLACSFEHKVNFVARWRALIPAITGTALLFLAWDGLFTHLGVWGFSHRYTMGLNFFGLPIEEILFFFAIPYCCVFTYEVLNRFVKWVPNVRKLNIGLGTLGTMLLIFGSLNLDRSYTACAFLLTALFIGAHLIWAKWPWMPQFVRAFFVTLLPFLIVNGILTGTGLDEPIVWYDNTENLGLRLITIPIEDTVYAFLLLGVNTAGYEYFKSRL